MRKTVGQWGASEERLVRGRTGVEAHLHWILQGNSRQAGPMYQGLAQDHVVGRALGFLGPSPGSDPPCSAPLGSPFLSLICPWVERRQWTRPFLTYLWAFMSQHLDISPPTPTPTPRTGLAYQRCSEMFTKPNESTKGLSTSRPRNHPATSDQPHGATGRKHAGVRSTLHTIP